MSQRDRPFGHALRRALSGAADFFVPSWLAGDAYLRLVRGTYLVRVLIAACSLLAAPAIPVDSPEQLQLFLLLIGGVYLPYALALFFAARRSQGPALRLAAVAGDVVVVFLFQLLFPPARFVGMYGYLLIVAYYSYVGGLGAGLALGLLGSAFTALAPVLGGDGQGLGAYPLAMYGMTLASLSYLLATATREQRRAADALRREIEERRRVEEMLRQQAAELERARGERRFRLVVEAAPSAMLMVGPDGRIALVNAQTERLFGYDRSELIGRPVELLVPERFRADHPLLRTRFFAEPRSRAMGADRELFGRHRDGSEFPVEIGLNPIQIDAGLFVLSSVVDITDLKRSEAMLQEKTEELARSNRELDQFAHVVSHDLKAPLRGISSLASWVADDCKDVLPDESREHLALLGQRVNRMSQLIDGVLAYSRVGRMRSVSELVDSKLVLEEVVDSLGPPRDVSVRIEGTLPVVRYDRTQLIQVFQNLIGNAMQHLGKPSGEVVVSCEHRGEEFEFSVRDDGLGIERRHFERIFRMFQALRPGSETTGLGLTIVKKITEMHGGSVSVESTPGAGTTFRFTVPKQRPPARGPRVMRSDPHTDEEERSGEGAG